MADDPNTSLPESESLSKDELIKLFDEEERSYFRRIVDMCKGLGQPRDSIEFKKAMIELQRLWAPIAAVLLMTTIIVVMSVIRITVDEKPPAIETQVIEPTEAEQLDEPPEEPPPPEDPPELEDVVDTDVVVDIDAPPTTSAEQSPQPSPVDAVAMTPSPVQLKGVFGSRSPGVRGAAIGRYGAHGTEKLVYGFLRWLKMKQGANGLWQNDTGYSALALLCYLAHGELPGSSPEFGTTVEKAIRGLLDDQIKTEDEARKDHANAPRSGGKHAWRRGEIGYFRHRDTCNYAHLVATYALSEAYAMTRIPDIKAAVERALPVILDGQNADGGWYYNMDAKCPTTDTSYVSWAVQALKAAKLAGFHDPRIVVALKKAAKGIKTVANDDGSFGYLNTAKKRSYGLTAPCVLILQMLDESDTDMCKKSIAYMDSWEPTFEKNHKASTSSAIAMIGDSPQYYCYYLSQVRFNMGDKHPAWLRWNQQQKRIYQAAAINIPAEKSGYVDHNGKPQYITYWPHKGAKNKFKGEANAIDDLQRLRNDPQTRDGKRLGFDVEKLVNVDAATDNFYKPSQIGANCFTALQLMVYYRNSPLAKGALTKIEEITEVKVEEDKGTEVEIEGLGDL